MQNLELSSFSFDLPENLIAQTPLKNRDNSKLMCLNKQTGEIIHEEHFKNVLNYLNKGDCLVLNDTKVLPARIFGKRKNTGANIEILLLSRIDKYTWEVLAKPGKRVKISDTIVFSDELEGVVENIVEDGKRIIKFKFNGVFEEILDKIGNMPLPPYIKELLHDKDRYQTIYAKNRGAAAAPTAGLHFTEELLKEIEKKGVKIAKLTLHIGLGTFRPIKEKNILEHKMHSEYYTLNEENANIINNIKKNGGKVICVGTTSLRALETIADEKGNLYPKEGWTDIFIYPGYKFKIVDELITNFHLPESSLIVLVSAFSNQNYVIKAYEEAVKNNYRFFSFGDAMFIKKW